MKNLDLELMGVQEMDAIEVKGTDGGMEIWLGIGKITSVLDGIKHNTGWKWFWQK